MLPASNRMDRAGIQDTLSSGAYYKGMCCILRGRLCERTQFAVITSRKVSSRAVVRNRVRRRVYAKLHRLAQKFTHPYCGIVICKPHIVSCTVRELDEELTMLLKKAGAF